MGYYASGSGSIVLRKMTNDEIKELYHEFLYQLQRVSELETIDRDFQTFVESGDPLKKVLDCINKVFGEFDGYYDNVNYRKLPNVTEAEAVYIDVLHEYEKYYEEGIKELLNILEPYVETGNIVFSGEDDCHWQFDFRDGKWHEDDGEICYGTDEPMEVTVKDKKVLVSKNGQMLTLSESDFRELESIANRELYYRQDVIEYLEKLIESGTVSEDVMNDEEAIDELLELYADYREDHNSGCDTDSIWSWDYCLEEAYCNSDLILKYKLK